MKRSSYLLPIIMTIGAMKGHTSISCFDVAMMRILRLNYVCVPGYAMAADFRLQTLVLRIGEEGWSDPGHVMKKTVVCFRGMTTLAIGRYRRIPLFSISGRSQQFSFLGAEGSEP